MDFRPQRISPTFHRYPPSFPRYHLPLSPSSEPTVSQPRSCQKRDQETFFSIKSSSSLQGRNSQTASRDIATMKISQSRVRPDTGTCSIPRYSTLPSRERRATATVICVAPLYSAPASESIEGGTYTRLFASPSTSENPGTSITCALVTSELAEPSSSAYRAPNIGSLMGSPP